MCVNVKGNIMEGRLMVSPMEVNIKELISYETIPHKV